MVTKAKEQLIEKLLRDGLSLTEVEEKSKVSHQVVRDIADQIGWDFSWRNKKDIYEENKEQYDDIYDLIVNEKHTLQEVGEMYGITRQRVFQILENMDIKIRDIQEQEDRELKNDVFKLLVTGDYTPAEVAEKLDLANVVVTRVMRLFTEEEVDAYKANYITKQFYKTKAKDEERMKIALDMWDDEEVETKDIAEKMNMTREYLNQLIIRCRKKYGWFPAKYAARYEPKENQDNINIQKLILKDKKARENRAKARKAAEKAKQKKADEKAAEKAKKKSAKKSAKSKKKRAKKK